MPRPQRSTPVDPPDDVATGQPAGSAHPEKGAGEFDADEFAALLAALPPAGRVELWRWSDQGQRAGWRIVQLYGVRDFDVDAVIRRWGGGDYRIIVRRPDDGGGMPWVTRREFSIDPAVQPERAGLAPASGAGSGPGIGSLVEAGFLQLLQLQLETTKQLVQPRENLADVLKVLVDVARPAAPAAAENPITLATQLLQLLDRKGGAGSDQIEALVGAFREGMQLARETGTPDDGLARLGMKVAEVVEQLGKQPAARVGAPPRLVVAPGGTAPAPAVAAGSTPAAAPGTPATQLDDVAAAFAPLWPVLRAAAQRDADPELYADLVADQLPEVAIEWIGSLMGHADYPSVVLQLLPAETAPAHRWLARVLLVLRDRPSDFAPQEEAHDDDA